MKKPISDRGPDTTWLAEIKRRPLGHWSSADCEYALSLIEKLKAREKKSVSVGQCMAELLCRDDIGKDYSRYYDLGRLFTALPDNVRKDIVDGIQKYLVEQLGEENVET